MRFPTIWYLAYAQSDQSLCLSLEYFMIVKLLTEHHGLSKLQRRLQDSSESTLVKMPHCWKSHDTAQNLMNVCNDADNNVAYIMTKS